MRSAGFCLALVLGSSVPFPCAAQSPTMPASQDAQAISVVIRSLDVAGGMQAIKAIEDYRATGHITYHLDEDVQGTVVVRGSDLDKFRMDANLPAGVRSTLISHGRMALKEEDGTITPIRSQAPMTPSRILLPYLLLAPALKSPGYSMVYKGLVQIDGLPAHDVQLRRELPGISDPSNPLREYFTVDFFIDASTFHVVMMQDTTPKRWVRQIRYSDYRPVGRVLAPFSLSEQTGSLQTWLIQVDQITFNSGLRDSDFRF